MPSDDQPLEKLGLLSEPVRRTLYEFVVRQAAPVDRDQAAAAAGIGRPLAAFHLDRLVRAGLLDVEYRRRSGRTGPGAGRPAKFYRRAASEQIDVSLPPRQYRLAAEILADGIERDPDDAALAAVIDSATDRGRRLGDAARAAGDGRAALLATLVANGYEPSETPDGTIRLRNCPFHALVDRHRDLTCSMNFALLSSLTAQLDDLGLAPAAQPEDGFCCVAFVPKPVGPTR